MMKLISIGLMYAIILMLVVYAAYSFFCKEFALGMICLGGALAVSSVGVLITGED